MSIRLLPVITSRDAVVRLARAREVRERAQYRPINLDGTSWVRGLTEAEWKRAYPELQSNDEPARRA